MTTTMRTLGLSVGLLLAGSALSACGDDPSPDGGGEGGEGQGGGGGGAAGSPNESRDSYSLGGSVGDLPSEFESHPPECETLVPLADLSIRLFASDGHEFYFDVTEEAARAGDRQSCAGSSTDPDVDCPNSATNVRIVSADSGDCSDTGKVELDLRGGETFRSWLEIPTFKLDTGEFQKLEFPSGDSQLRLNNGQNGATVLREPVALRVFRALGYPAPRSSFVRTGSNVWDSAFSPGVRATHVLVQAYKKEFFDDELPDVRYVWEGKGDPFSRDDLEAGFRSYDCQWARDGACDDDALQDVVTLVRSAPRGPGFLEATASRVDWPRVHEYLCLSALTDLGDDWAHAGNNVVLAMNDAGKVYYLPYSTDASGGYFADQDEATPYRASAFLAETCFEDENCKNAAIATCDDLLDQFETLDAPTSIVDERCAALETNGLARPGDEEACRTIRGYYEDAAARVRELLDAER